MKYGRLAVAIFFWYTASAIANTSSRKFLTTVSGSPILLTFAQFLASICLLSLFVTTPKEISVIRILSSMLKTSKGREIDMLLFKLAAVYTIGFIFVNAGYVYVNVSLAETLRAAEPLVSVFLVRFFLPSEKTSYVMIASMILIFLGGLLSSISDTSFSVIGLVFVTISNLSFSTRSLLTKQVKEVLDIDSFQLFLIISRIGCTLLGVALLMEYYLGSLQTSSIISDVESFSFTLKLLAVNNLSYFLYNQMSFYILSQVTMVSHAVTNALRRIVTIMFSVWYFRNNISIVNGIGIFCAIFGLLVYSYSKQSVHYHEKIPTEVQV